MDDEAWVEDLARRAAPLRVSLPPWNEVMARELWRSPLANTRPQRLGRFGVATAVAFAAGLAVTFVAQLFANTEVARREVPAVVVGHDPTPTDHHNEAAPRDPAPPRAQAPSAAAHSLAPAPESPAPKPVTSGLETAHSDGAAMDHRPAKPRASARPKRKPHGVPAAPAGANDQPSAEQSQPVSDELPNVLDATAIKQGIERIKPMLAACGRKYGTSDVIVRARLSIVGATGKVNSVRFPDPAGLHPELLNCLARAVETARFPRFRTATIGVLYPIKL